MSSKSKNPSTSVAAANRQSGRIQATQGVRVIDETTKKRRIQKQLEKLEKDNFQEDPHANLMWNKAIPKFNDELVYSDGSNPNKAQKKRAPLMDTSKLGESATKKGKKLVAELTKTRFRKTFTQMLEESEKKLKEEEPEERTYTDITAKPSTFPARKFCAVCGLLSKYKCVQCHAYYCSISCRSTHIETRCLKWTV